MRSELQALLRCPACLQSLVRREDAATSGVVQEGRLDCPGCSATYPIVGAVPRFVPASNYADSFGFQWNRFRRTQLDSHSGVPITRERFLKQSGWQEADVRNRVVLDVGCGAGRFAEIALSLGAHVVAVDYSAAVDACQANLGGHPRLHVVQADMFALPFMPGTFDAVYCFGVLQHTPDPSAAFRAIARQVAPGGRLAVDLYPKLWKNLLWPKYWLRPLTARIPPRRLFPLVEHVVPWVLPLSRVLGRVPRLGRWLRHAVPVANYEGIYPLTKSQLEEWAVLDTFDMLSPIHDHPQSAATIEQWLYDAGFVDRQVYRVGHLVGRGTRPTSA